MTARPPDAVFIGPYRAGTTFLRAYFSHHPEIVWTRQAQFFLLDENFTEALPYPPEVPDDAEGKCFIDMFEGVGIGYVMRNNPDWSAVGFVPGAPIDGEFVRLDHEEMAQRIRSKASDAKILMVLRNQIDWLRSTFLHHITFLPPKRRTFGAFLNTVEGKSAVYAGLFDQTITAYYDAFGRDQVHVMLLEDLDVDPQGALRGLCRFLGVTHVDYEPPAQEQNRGRGIAAGRMISVLSRWGVPDRQIDRLGGLLRPIFSLICGVVAQDVISPKEKALLRAFYAASNCRTARLTGLALGHRGYPL